MPRQKTPSSYEISDIQPNEETAQLWQRYQTCDTNFTISQQESAADPMQLAAFLDGKLQEDQVAFLNRLLAEDNRQEGGMLENLLAVIGAEPIPISSKLHDQLIELPNPQKPTFLSQTESYKTTKHGTRIWHILQSPFDTIEKIFEQSIRFRFSWFLPCLMIGLIAFGAGNLGLFLSEEMILAASEENFFLPWPVSVPTQEIMFNFGETL